MVVPDGITFDQTATPASQPPAGVTFDQTPQPAPNSGDNQTIPKDLQAPEHGSDEWYKQTIAKAMPEGSLEAGQKYLVDPFERLVAWGTKHGGAAAVGTAKNIMEHPIQSAISPESAIAFGDEGTEEFRKAHPVIAGAARGAGGVVGGVAVDPRNWPLMGAGEALPVLNKLLTAGFGAMMTKGAYNAAKQLHDNWDNMTPEERSELATQTGLNAVMATASALHMAEGKGTDIKNRVKAATDLGMQTKETSQGERIPVRSETLGGKVAGQLVSPDVMKDIAQEKTAPAVQKAVGNIVREATGSTAYTISHPEAGDSFGLAGHSANLRAQATPVFDRIDELYDGALARAKDKMSSANGDQEQYAEGRAEQKALYDKSRDQLADEGMDVDHADQQYRRSIQVEKMRAAFERSINPDTGDLSGKRLSSEIGKLVQKGEKGAFERGDLTQEHVDALKEVANIMKDQEKPPTQYIYGAAKTIAALTGVHLGGFGGLVEGTIGESAAEAVSRRVSDKLFADALAEPSAASRLPKALKTGDVQPVVSALQKSDPTWLDRTKAFVKNVLIKGTRGEAGAPGTVFEPQQVEELKRLGMSADDIAGLGKHESAPVQLPAELQAGSGGHAGGGAVSAEEIQRGKNWMVGKNGLPSYDGAQFRPEETPDGGAHVTELPNGQLRTNAGDLTPAMEAKVRAAMSERDRVKQAAGEAPTTFVRQPQTTADIMASPEHRDTLGAHEVGTRLGTKTVKGEKSFAPNDPTALSGLDSLNAANSRGDEAGNGKMTIKQKLVAAFNDYDNTGLTFTPEELKSPDTAIEKIINHLVDNNKWLYNQMPPVIRDAAQKWYDFAHQTTYEKAQDSGLSQPQVAGVYATLSPQNPWHNNKMIADRLIDLYKNERTHEWSPAMDKKASEIAGVKTATPEFKQIMNAIRGKKFDELADVAKGDKQAQLGLEALWLRVLDEAESKDRQIKVYGPDGNIINHEGGKMAWSSLSAMSKALDIIKNGRNADGTPDLELISRHLGEGNKVRNFYNNIINPWSDKGHFTADTHQVGAALLQPVSSKSPAVAHNFGGSAQGYKGSNPGKNAVAGVKGTYPVYHEAGVRASNDLGVDYPRQFQSMTWEGIRSLMGDDKKTPELKKAVDIIWKRHREGDLTLDEARNKIMEASGGFTKPEWMTQEQWDAEDHPNKAENVLANRSPENEPKQIIAADAARQMGVKNQKALDMKAKKAASAKTKKAGK